MDDILEQLRNDHKDFDRGNLEGFFGHEPFDLFRKWYAEAFETKQLEPNAFVLSTVNPDEMPSSRILYLKELLDNAFIFYTNYQSHKGHDLASLNLALSMKESSNSHREDSEKYKEFVHISAKRGNEYAKMLDEFMFSTDKSKGKNKTEFK